jgi:hypothetical protein
VYSQNRDARCGAGEILGARTGSVDCSVSVNCGFMKAFFSSI